MKVVIVGGVAGGASAAARIRRLDEHAQIIMIERSGYVSYANCGLPYYVGGVIKEQEELMLQTPESFWDRFRIDVLATAIRAKMTALELTELDLSYAPPYSSAKDPVNMAGFMIEDLESGKVRQFHWNDVEDLPCNGSATLLDVRTEGEYRRGHLNGFRNIPLDDLREHLDELERDKPVYVNCQTGLRSYLACRLLTQYGFSCSHLSGGYSFYQVVTQEQQTARSAYPCGMEKL